MAYSLLLPGSSLQASPLLYLITIKSVILHRVYLYAVLVTGVCFLFWASHLSAVDRITEFFTPSCIIWPFPQQKTAYFPWLKLRHALCFPQWPFSRRDRSQDSQYACAGGLALLPLHHHLKIPLPTSHQAATSLQPASKNETVGADLKICTN